MMNSELFSNQRVLCITDKYLLTYKSGIIRLFGNNKQIDSKRIGDWKNKLSIVERLCRLEPRCATMISSFECIFSFNGCVYYYNFQSKELKIEHYFDRGMRNPLSFCKMHDSDNEVNVYYGEYIWNVNKGPVAIYRRYQNSWEKVFEFSNNLVTHIHNLIYDDEREVFYILTGDSDAESGIWIADPKFNHVHLLVGGKQEYRSCVAFPVVQGLIIATDTPLEKNYLSLIVIENNEVREVKRVLEIPGSCIYGTTNKSKYYISTTVEPDSSLSKWDYRLTYKLGKGISDRYSHILEIDKDGTIKEVFKAKKDIMPIWLFQFGNFLFPYNETNKLLIVAQSLQLGHGITIELK